MLLGALAAATGLAAVGCASGAGAHRGGAAKAAAHRSVPRGFFGVDADGAATDGSVAFDGQVASMVRAGVETLGVTFDWSKAQPTQGGPIDFSATDRLVLGAAQRGIRVFPVVIEAPPWARLHPDLAFSPPASPSTYAAYLGALVRRYGRNGAFWAAHREVRALPILDWQVWNEPAGADHDDRGSVFWQDGNKPFYPRYIALLKAARHAVKAADPRARVVLAALVGRSWQTLAGIYHHGARPYFDAVALHPYTEKVHDVSRIVRYDRGVMNRRGDKRKPILVTEIAWPAFVPVSQLHKVGRKRYEAIQSGWLRSTVNDLVAKRRALGIQTVLWYTWLTRDASPDYTFDYSGLMRLDPGGKVVAKPALGVFTSIARHAEGRR